jgi:hypothetical protein
MSWTLIVISAALVIAGFLVCGVFAAAVGKEVTLYIKERSSERGRKVDQQADYEKPTSTDWLLAAGISVVVILYVGAFIWVVL